MNNNIFTKILGKHVTWLNSLALFSNKFNRKDYNKQISTIKQAPPEIKNYNFLSKFITTGIVSASCVGLFSANPAMAESGQGNSNFSYAGYSARQIKDIANCISKVDTTTSLCGERGSQGWHDWAKQNLHNDTRGQFTMRGDTVQIRLVGVNVDNRADGKGKAGLTFMTTTYVSETNTNMADTNNNAGGYRDVRNRKDFNEEQYKNTISSDAYKYLTPVLKTQDNQANGEMNNDKHSATSNAIVEKVSMPSPLELNMNVTQQTSNSNYNGLTPTGLTQYNSGYKDRWDNGVWYANYGYLYSGNASYEYYRNNTSNIGEYCKLVKGDGSYNNNKPSCKGTPDAMPVLFLRSPLSDDLEFFAGFDSRKGELDGYQVSYVRRNHVAALLSF